VSVPYMLPDPLPPVAIRAVDWEPIELGADQLYSLPMTYEWSRDLDWWNDFRQVSSIKYTAKPPERPW
jgi:hypothetical protein